MKLSKRNVSVIVVAAVLVSAVGVGLLIRQACMGPRPRTDQAEQEIRQQQLALSQQRPGGRDTRETLEDRMKRKELRAQAVEKMAALTEEEKAQYRDQIREKFSSRTAHAAEAERAKSLLAQTPPTIDSLSLRQPVDENEAPSGAAPEPNQAGQR